MKAISFCVSTTGAGRLWRRLGHHGQGSRYNWMWQPLLRNTQGTCPWCLVLATPPVSTRCILFYLLLLILALKGRVFRKKSRRSAHGGPSPIVLCLYALNKAPQCLHFLRYRLATWHLTRCHGTIHLHFSIRVYNRQSMRPAGEWIPASLWRGYIFAVIRGVSRLVWGSIIYKFFTNLSVLLEKKADLLYRGILSIPPGVQAAVNILIGN